ncbi:uncharacterized protein LOC112463243 [Temnothorax curvispinosus]|uniref:Uncharacterized protein LOC112463243 n=1 Tax=Temnothorax curvispinosus TaxID=300111 RepID=A0A6J1QTR2_9HYME|nr:uncharacterized protein LOC112463243 [Temnothorax curvispinosus]
MRRLAALLEERLLNGRKMLVLRSREKRFLGVFKPFALTPYKSFTAPIQFAIGRAFAERIENACLTTLGKAFAERLKNLTANLLHAAYTERSLKSVASAFQNFHETLYTAFYKRSGSVQNPTTLSS